MANNEPSYGDQIVDVPTIEKVVETFLAKSAKAKSGKEALDYVSAITGLSTLNHSGMKQFLARICEHHFVFISNDNIKCEVCGKAWKVYKKGG